MKDYLRLVKLLRPHIGIFIIAVCCMILSSALSGISLFPIIPLLDRVVSNSQIEVNASVHLPQFATAIIDKINTLPKIELLNIMLVFVLISLFLREVFTFLQTYFMRDVSERVVRDIKNKIYKKLLTLPLDYYSKNPTGKLVSRITYDTAVVRDAISEPVADLFNQPLQIITNIFVVIGVQAFCSIPWWLILLSISLVPAMMYPVIRIGKLLRKISQQSQEKMGDINTTLYETITGNIIVKAFSNESEEEKRFVEQNRQFYKLSMKSVKRMTVINPLTEAMSIFCSMVLVWFGGRAIIAGSITAGALTAIMVAILLLIKPFKRLSKVYGAMEIASAAGARIYEILDEVPTIEEIPGARALDKVKGTVEFKNVGFSYDKAVVLKNINLRVKVGEIIAIVGPSGVGKTTLVNLIPRFYDPSSGSVEIDGVDIKNVTFKSLRGQIGIVSQDTFLFNETVGANISYGNKNCSKDDIIKSAKLANAHDFILKMPKGYDTIVGERGFRLSGGEKQRLSIARALLKNPPILILDEATSQLDSESERLVQDAIDKLIQNRTVFVIAHRLSTIKNATRIIVLDKGEIIEGGTHEALILKGGNYKRLYELQFKGAD
ncbi:MAG: ABC transporter ATP-binding protein [Candidatus Omnitrophota bacterium]|nr:ABC transporter ATP-binding protein [Candidatus Omnitrophota bacterium]